MQQNPCHLPVGWQPQSRRLWGWSFGVIARPAKQAVAIPWAAGGPVCHPEAERPKDLATDRISAPSCLQTTVSGLRTVSDFGFPFRPLPPDYALFLRFTLHESRFTKSKISLANHPFRLYYLPEQELP